MEKKNIKQLIAENKTDEVIESLMNLSDKIKDEHLKNSVVILSARYKRFVEQNILGVSGSEEENIHLAQLNKAVLDLIDEIPAGYFSDGNPGNKEPPPVNNLDATLNEIIKVSVIVLFMFSALSLIGIMIYFIFFPKSAASISSIGEFIPFWTSLTGLVTSGFFYFLSKYVK